MVREMRCGRSVSRMSRHIKFDRLHNCRDLGGYGAEDGCSVRWGRLYRSDSLAKLQGADRDRFLALGVRTVIDLRYPWEAAARGRVPDGEALAYFKRKSIRTSTPGASWPTRTWRSPSTERRSSARPRAGRHRRCHRGNPVAGRTRAGSAAPCGGMLQARLTSHASANAGSMWSTPI
jgi:hypothetical protein